MCLFSAYGANGVCRNTFSVARKTEFFFRCGFYINVAHGNIECFCHVFAHILYKGGKFGLLRYYGSVYIGNGKPVRCEYIAAFFEDQQAGNTFYALIVIGEVEAYVAFRASAEKRV